MNRILIFFLLISFSAFAQQKRLSYIKTPLVEVISDLELKFNVRFSYNSSLLKSKFLTLNRKADLKTFLDDIASEFSLEFTFLDKENIIIKSFTFPDLNANILDEVVLVSEYLTSGFDQNKKDGSLRLKPNQLGILPGLTEPDVLQSLQLLPGISSPTESATNLVIRGGMPDQNLLLYDGIRVYHQGHLFGMISPFNPYIVESVDVFRSGTSARFGERISGVVDITSLNKIPLKLEAGAGLNLLHADAFLKVPVLNKKGAFLFSARRSVNDIFNSPTFNLFSDKVFQNTKIETTNNLVEEEELTVLDDNFQFSDFNGKFLYKPNKNNEFSISALLIDNQLSYANIDLDNDGSRDQLDTKNFGISSLWKTKFSNKLNFLAGVRYSNYESAYKLNQIESNQQSLELSKNNIVKDFGGEIQFQYKHNSDITFYAGYDVASFDVSYDLVFALDAEDNDSFAEKLSTHNLYLETEYKKNDFYSRFGIRTSYFNSDNKFYIEPRLFATYKLSESFKLKTSAEIKNQTISQLVSFEFNELGLDDTIWVVADEDEIPVQNNKQITFGFEYSKDSWLIDAEFYSKNVKGLTSLTRGFNSNNQLDDYEQGTSRINGIDVLIKKKFNRIRTWLSYTYSKNDFTFPDLQDSSFPATFDQRHVLTWANSLKLKKYQFSIGWQFATGKPFSNPAGIVVDELNYDSLNNSRLPVYHKLDASVLYNFHLDKQKELRARLGISFINLYNRDNDIDKQFIIDNDNQNQIIEQSTIGLGLTTNAVFRVYF